jgi:uncharacterized protein with GYD domain
MPLYLGRFGYTTDAWAKLIAEPEDRTQAAREAAESLGGTLHSIWWAFGDCDGYWLGEFPDNASAVAIAVAASGTMRLNETTVLITADELLEALEKARAVSFRPPGGTLSSHSGGPAP